MCNLTLFLLSCVREEFIFRWGVAVCFKTAVQFNQIFDIKCTVYVCSYVSYLFSEMGDVAMFDLFTKVNIAHSQLKICCGKLLLNLTIWYEYILNHLITYVLLWKLCTYTYQYWSFCMQLQVSANYACIIYNFDLWNH